MTDQESLGDAVSVKDVAALAGVSVGTVSNVLNRPDRVSPETRDRVSAAIAELGFVRNESARHLRAGSSRTVGLVVLDVANPFFTDVARGVEDTASAAGLAVILCNTDEKPAKEDAYLELLEEQRVRGILITPADVDQRPADRAAPPRHPGGAARPQGAPAATSARCPSTTARAATSRSPTCIESGHRRIAFIGGPLTIAQVADRLARRQDGRQAGRPARATR